jgi:hypothetical protein
MLFLMFRIEVVLKLKDLRRFIILDSNPNREERRKSRDVRLSNSLPLKIFREVPSTFNNFVLRLRNYRRCITLSLK